MKTDNKQLTADDVLSFIIRNICNERSVGAQQDAKSTGPFEKW